jgi:RimJ/RimL family protein N-acetyltransferase
MNIKQQSSIPMAPKVIQTQRLTLRQPTEADVETVFGYASDPLVTRLMDWPRLTSQEQVTAYFVKCFEAWVSGSEYSWILAEAGTDVAIGGIACRVRDTDADFGYVLSRRHWGFGFATEAASAIVAWTFSLPTVRRMWATCDIENMRSARVLEKAGLAREGLVPGGIIRPNLSPEPRDAYIYAKQRTDA